MRTQKGLCSGRGGEKTISVATFQNRVEPREAACRETHACLHLVAFATNDEAGSETGKGKDLCMGRW